MEKRFQFLKEVVEAVLQARKSCPVAIMVMLHALLLPACGGHAKRSLSTCSPARVSACLNAARRSLQVWPPSRVAVRLSPNGLYNGMGSPDNVEQFLFACSQLAPFSLGYLHVLDRESPGNFDFHKLCKPVTLREVREVYGGGGGALVGNVGYGFDSGDEAVRSGYADAVAFGRPYISSPDLAERFANGWPLAPPAPVECYYATKDGPKGYVDFPPYDPAAGAGGGRGSRKEQKQPLPAGVVAEEQRSVKREAETVGGVFSPS